MGSETTSLQPLFRHAYIHITQKRSCIAPPAGNHPVLAHVSSWGINARNARVAPVFN
ncbi:hypothetical protein LTSEMON_2661 [Salmonella enterica subsp. enterica serovar Montevideo str. S5-403]|uniref:Uncharacterized protein n=1 Tax=Salmonella enterica subsp. enterica serovar Montevideo str. S5-403 TaxID=913242 RepID=G5Q3R8_SALMO|nr:hypothetical protein LTSEMON_2661 [Salmonella enterica subsp. enterica serovar Montevideo str. S5-403]